MFSKCFLNLMLLLSVLICCPVSGQETATSIDFFGNRNLSIEKLKAEIGLVEGKTRKFDSREIKKKLLDIPGVEDADVVSIHYPGNLALFIGIRETGQPGPQLRSAPTGEMVIEEDLVQRYDEIMELLMPAIKAGKAGEDRSAGHSLSEFPPMREKQEALIPIVNKEFATLAKVLRESGDDKSRAVAANVLAYADDKASVARELEFACNDSSSLVRNNAVRALGVLAGYDQSNDQVDLGISSQPFLQLLQSVKWTDRNKGAALIDALSVGRDVLLMTALRRSYLSELEEMAKWKSNGHYLFALRVLARIADIDEKEISDRAKAAKTHEERLEWVDELLEKIADLDAK